MMIKMMVRSLTKQITSNLYVFSEKKPQEKSSQITLSFTDRALQENKQKPITNGRSWKAEQLRLKSTDDLHKLWYVCVRQKNLVLADELAQQHDPVYIRKGGKIRRVERLDQTMSRILHVIHERQRIKKEYRKKLQQEYIQKKKAELQAAVSTQPDIPEITRQMLRQKYEALRKGKDNVEYLEKIWKRNQESQQRHQRAEERVQKLDPAKQFSSFWEYQMTIGQRPTQNQILKTHIKNWKSLNLKQRKIILGFLNARRSKDAKSTFVRELKILGQKIAEQQMKSRSQNSSSSI